MPLNSPFLRIFASGIACMSFAYMFGGVLGDCVNAFITGIILQVFLIPLKKTNVTSVLVNILGGAVISFMTLTLINLGIGKDHNVIIIGSLMPLLPGHAITNAIRDILEGDYLSGGARIMDAVLIATAVAAGSGVALKIWLFRFGGVAI